MGLVIEQTNVTASLTVGQGVKLSRSEIQVLRLIAMGHDSKTVADLLFVSKRTVDTHLATIFLKLDVSNRLSAIRLAYRYGLLPFEP